MRRRIRLRRTAPPCAFFTLVPKRLMSRPLGRMNTTNGWFDRRRPSRYTASNSERRTSRQARGKSSRGRLDGREGVASFFAASRKDLPSTLGLHACAKAMLLMAAPHTGLIGAFRQRTAPQPAKAHTGETASLVEPRRPVKKPLGTVLSYLYDLDWCTDRTPNSKQPTTYPFQYSRYVAGLYF